MTKSEGAIGEARHRRSGDGYPIADNDPRQLVRARVLLRKCLRHGPWPGAQIETVAEAAGIPEHALLAAADQLGVLTRRGEWRLPG